MRPVFFSDLDDTIFQTARKMDKEGAMPVTMAVEALNGNHSFMSPSQALMMNWLLGSTRFIPVTARSIGALQRCKLAFDDYQVCTNGAIIFMPDGRLDEEWFEKMKREAESAKEGLNELLAYVHQESTPGKFRAWIAEEFETGFYFCVKSNQDTHWLDDIDDGLSRVAGRHFVRHRNDNNLSFTPLGISKRHAVEYLTDKFLREKQVPVFGMGDSLTDLPFMATCDLLVIPKNSQIDRERLRSGSA